MRRPSVPCTGAMIQVTAPRLEAIHADAPRWRLAVDLTVDAGACSGTEEVWLEGPGSADTIDADGTPWAVMLAPLAAHLGVPLIVDAPVQPQTAAGIAAVSRRWSEWYPGVSPVRLEGGVTGSTGPRAHESSSARIAAFFTGGVDSLCTALDHRSNGSGVRDLISVHGFDIPVSEIGAFGRMVDRFQDWADAWGGRVVDLRTNLRETRAGSVPWGPLAHGCALIGSGLALGPRYDVLRIAATGGERDPHPWGSHLETDPLLGTATMRVEHHGADLARWEKVRRIVEDGTAMSLLRVCWRSGSDLNCGRCSKCLRTMALLDLSGALDDAPTFPRELPLDALARVHVKESWDTREFMDLVALGVRCDRGDIAGAARRAIRRSRRRGRAIALLDRLVHTPALGAVARSWRSRIQSGWIS